MHIQQEQYQTEIRESMRGGNGSVVFEHISKDCLPDHMRLMAKITLHQGCSIGYHVHENETEIFYVLSGCGLANDDGVTFTLSAGETLITSSGHGHSIENRSAEPLVILASIILD